MSIFDVNYQNWALNELPAPKRKPGLLNWLYALLYPLQWRHDINYNTYINGSSDNAYSLTNTYTKGQRVIYYIQAGGLYYGDNAVYEANTNVPINTPPTAANQVNANGAGYWIQVQPNFIGVYERLGWSCQQLTMEIALNRWFNVANFSKQQWDHTGAPPYTQIYIDTNVLDSGEEYWPPVPIGYYWPNQSVFDVSYWPPVPGPVLVYDFTIYVPNTIFNHLVLGSVFSPGHTENISSVTRNGSIIRALVDKFNAVGMLYNITTY